MKVEVGRVGVCRAEGKSRVHQYTQTETHSDREHGLLLRLSAALSAIARF